MSNPYWLNDAQMERLKPFFPKSHGKPRVDDRRVLSGMIFVDRNGLRGCDAPKEHDPAKTLYNLWPGSRHLNRVSRFRQPCKEITSEPRPVL